MGTVAAVTSTTADQDVTRPIDVDATTEMPLPLTPTTVGPSPVDTIGDGEPVLVRQPRRDRRWVLPALVIAFALVALIAVASAANDPTVDVPPSSTTPTTTPTTVATTAPPTTPPAPPPTKAPRPGKERGRGNGHGKGG